METKQKASTVIPEEPVVDMKPRFPSIDDFIFLDDRNKPFRVRNWGDKGEPWLFYWNKGTESWVSFRQADPVERMKWYLRRSLSAEHALMYEGGVPFLNREANP